MIMTLVALVVLPPPLRLDRDEMRLMTSACALPRSALFQATDGNTRMQASLPLPAVRCLLAELKKRDQKKAGASPTPE